MLTRQSEQGPHHSQKGDVCHTRRLRTIFSGTQRCNCFEWLQHCSDIATLHQSLKIVDANRPLKTSKEGAFIGRACIPLCLSSLPAPPKFNNFAPNIVHPQSTTTFVINMVKTCKLKAIKIYCFYGVKNTIKGTIMRIHRILFMR